MEPAIKTVIILELKKRLSGAFSWIIPELERILNAQGGEVRSSTLRIGLNPAFGESYAACIIHAPLVQSAEFQPLIPKPYIAVLRRFNGARFHCIDLFGVLEDESNRRHCLAIDLANQFWISEFRRLPAGVTYFGARKFSYDENIGYFYDSSLQVVAIRKSGETIKSWPSVEEMLRDEWEISKKLEAETRNCLRLPK